MRALRILLPGAMGLLLSACAGVPSSQSAGGSAVIDPERQAEAEIRSGTAAAVQELVTSSRTYRADGDYSRAMADIERAIRIEPRNPYLWLELGETHLSNDDSRQAAAMARKAMSVAGPDDAARSAAENLLRRATRQ